MSTTDETTETTVRRRLTGRAKTLLAAGVVAAVAVAATITGFAATAAAEHEAATVAHTSIITELAEVKSADAAAEVELAELREIAAARLVELTALAKAAKGLVSSSTLAELAAAIDDLAAVLETEDVAAHDFAPFPSIPEETEAISALTADISDEVTAAAARTAGVNAITRAIQAAVDAAEARIPGMVESLEPTTASALKKSPKATSASQKATTAAAESATEDFSVESLTALAAKVKAVRASHDKVAAAEAEAARKAAASRGGSGGSYYYSPSRGGGGSYTPPSTGGGGGGGSSTPPIDRTRRITHNSNHLPGCNGARMIKMYSATTSSGGGFRMDSVSYPYHVDTFDTPTGYGMNVYRCDV